MATKKQSRYTIKDLEDDVAQLNALLSEAGIDFGFDVGSRNNYTAVDLYIASEWAEGFRGTERVVICGTPRECLEETRAEYYRLFNKASREG